MPVSVDADALSAGARQIQRRSGECRELTAAAARLDGPADPAVGAALREVADACADALELVALDLEVVAARTLAAAAAYTAVERAVAAAAAGRTR
jgi:hypothetical protein